MLDELQSDAHKAGSKFGYTKRGTSLELKIQKLQARKKKLEEELAEAVDQAKQGKLPDYMKIREKLESELLDIEIDIKQEVSIPDMPFQQRKGSGWAQLGIKRALMEAAEKDYDTLAMTTAQQQVDRYDHLSNVIDFKGFYQRYDRDYIKILNKFGKKYGQKVEMIEVLQGDEIVEVPSINITQEWKDDIQRGLSQFNKGGKVLNKLKRNCNK